MNIFECINSRRSIREFQKEPVDDNLIGLMLYMATQAPSSGNSQDWYFCVVKDEDQKKKLAEAALNQMFISQAPVVLVVCSDLEKISRKYGTRGEVMYSLQDTASAVTIIMLTARALGLDSCWIGAFDEDAVKLILELPDKLRPVAILPIGYAAERPEKPERIPFENITSVDSFGKKYQLAALQPHARLGEQPLEPMSVYLEEIFKKVMKEVEPKVKKRFGFKYFLKRLKQH